MATELRNTGIRAVGDIAWGTHFCHFYQTKDDLLDILIPYFKTGLENNEFCLWVVSDPLGQEEARNALRQAVPEADQYLAAGHIEIVPHTSLLSSRQLISSTGRIEIVPSTEWYLQGGAFVPGRVINGWNGKLAEALAEGYAGMRVNANESWLTNENWKDFSKYEQALDETLGNRQMIVLCSYPLTGASAAEILDVAHTHQFAIAKRNGQWEILEVPELRQAKQALKRLNEELEQRIAERTQRLAAANADLSREIAERQRAEDALRASEARLQAAIDAADIGLWDWDVVSGQITWLGHHNKLFGFAPGEFDGTYRGFEKRVHPEDLAELNRVVQRARDDRSEYAHEYRVIWPDGSIHWISGQGRFVYNEMAQPVRMNGVVLDITKRKQAEKALQETNSKLELILNNSPLPIIGEDADARVTSWNKAAERLFGWTAQEVLGNRCPAVPLEEREDYLNMVHRVMQGETYLGLVRYRQKKGGTLLSCSISVAPQHNGRGEPIGITLIIEDISARQQAEEALRRSESNFRTLADQSLQAIAIYQDQKIVYANPAQSAILGYTIEEFKSMAVEQLVARVHPDDRAIAEERARKRMAGEEISPSAELRVARKDGSTRWVQVFNNPIEYNGQPALLAVSMDITERKRAEEEMNRQAARAETLARIAARLNKQLDLDAVIHAVCQEAVDTFKVSQATMSLYDKERDLLVYAGGINIPPEYIATMEPINRARFDDFLRAMGPIMVVPDIQSVPDVPNVEFSSHLDVRTVVTVAMLRDQELIGVLVLGVNGHVREFDKDELTLLKAISDQAAQAIANALLLKTANEQREQLRALSAKLVEAQETERRTIARELHDEIGQVLNAVNANLHAIQLSKNRATRAERLEESINLVDDALVRVRNLSLDLRPSLLDDFGLVAALEWFVEHQAERSGFAAEFIAEPRNMRFSPSLETTVFRVAQSALTNIVRHARAKQVHVELSQGGAELVLVIRDDGTGFDVHKALEGASHGATLGLASMQERVRLAGGQVEIKAAPGQGTEIRARFPVNESKQ